MYRDPNALRACNKNGLLKTLIECDDNLQIIQKQLDAYLETKRMVFPRFYFLSNDDETHTSFGCDKYSSFKSEFFSSY